MQGAVGSRDGCSAELGNSVVSLDVYENIFLGKWPLIETNIQLVLVPINLFRRGEKAADRLGEAVDRAGSQLLVSAQAPVREAAAACVVISLAAAPCASAKLPQKHILVDNQSRRACQK